MRSAARRSKHFRLTIEHHARSNELEFVLSDVERNQELAKGSCPNVTSELLQEMASAWHVKLRDAATEFRRLIDWARMSPDLNIDAALESGALAEPDVPRYIMLSDVWRTKVEPAVEKLRIQLGEHVFDYSLVLQAKLFPPDESEFWRVFSEKYERPLTKAFNDTRRGLSSWNSVPLLQLHVVQPELLAVPWWLARTYDQRSFWCCRYALAVSPAITHPHPPDFQERSIRLLTITRPTIDLQPWVPFSAEFCRTLRDAAVPWLMLDGVVGRRTGETAYNALETEIPTEFRGVTVRDLSQALLTKPRPNCIYYHGHSHADTDSKRGPILLLHNESGPASETRPTFSAENATSIYFPVPLLSAAPPQTFANSILILNTCAAFGEGHVAQHVQDYVRANSAFVGTSYPILADTEVASGCGILHNILDSIDGKFVAHAILDTQRLEVDVDRPDFVQIYRSASCVLFGSVLSHPILNVSSKDKPDRRTQIRLHVTDRWIGGLRRLALQEGRGLTFTIKEIDEREPTSGYELPQRGSHIGLGPLARVIDLCLDRFNQYVILGPAFTSRSCVGLAGSRVSSLQELLDQIVEGRRVEIGLLTPKMTTTYMAQRVLEEELSRHCSQPALGKLIYRYPKDRRISSLVDDAFIQSVDAFLVLDEQIEQIRQRGLALLIPNLEQRTAESLHQQRLPRGVFYTRRSMLARVSTRTALIEFCDTWNEQIDNTDPDGVNQTFIPCLTLNRAYANDLRAIAAFGSFSNPPFASTKWECFAFQPISESEGDNGITPVEPYWWPNETSSDARWEEPEFSYDVATRISIEQLRRYTRQLIIPAGEVRGSNKESDAITEAITHWQDSVWVGSDDARLSREEIRDQVFATTGRASELFRRLQNSASEATATRITAAVQRYFEPYILPLRASA